MMNTFPSTTSSNSLFGTQQPASSSSLFGTKPGGTLFGATNTTTQNNLFGQQSTSTGFGSAAGGGGILGANKPATSVIFLNYHEFT